MGFTPGVLDCVEPWLNPKAGKLFRMSFSGHAGGTGVDGFRLEGPNIVEGFRRHGYRTIGSGAVDWFNTTSETGAVLAALFERFHFAGNTWSLSDQLAWIEAELQHPFFSACLSFSERRETHVPYWHEGASWDPWPSPCSPFGGPDCSASKSRSRQLACLEWVDYKLASLITRFSDATILACADHGDCWGEDGLWEHGISHPATPRCLC